MEPQDMSYEQLMELAEETMKDPRKKAAAMAVLNQKAPDGLYKKLSAGFNDLSPKEKQQLRDISKFECDEFMNGDGYKNGKTDTVGYIQCCDVYGFCGGSKKGSPGNSNGSNGDEPKLKDMMVEIMLNKMKKKLSPGEYAQMKADYENWSSMKKQEHADEWKPICDEFMQTAVYKSGDKDTFGYLTCCDSFKLCSANSGVSNGGMSSCIIFFFIILAFFWRRNM